MFSRRTSFLTLPGEDAAKEQIIEDSDSRCEETDEVFKLTAAEKRVYQLVCQGLSNADITASLQISPNTVKFHMRNILQKAGVKNRHELLTLVYNHGAGQGTVLLGDNRKFCAQKKAHLSVNS